MPLTKHNNNNHTAPGTATGAALGGAVGHHEGHTATGAALGGTAGHHFAGSHQQADPAVRPSGVHDTQQMAAPGATTTVDGMPIPASGAMNNRSKGAGEKAFIGKLEHAAGTLLCSSSLKAKGMQKEQEAQALKVQSAELSAAERLENEARARRERAVGHGAHPDVLKNPNAANNNSQTQAGGGFNNSSTIQPQGNTQHSPNQVPNNVYAHDHHDGRYPNVAAPLS